MEENGLNYMQYGTPNAIDDVLTRASARASGHEVQRAHGGVLGDWLDPAGKEERQLGQQMALMAAEPSIKMKAMKAAGINPLTAAAGIAGAGSTSTPQPASSTNPIGDVAGAVGNIAGAFNSVAGGVSTISKLDDELNNIRSDTEAKLAAAGLDKVNTEAVLTDNKYRGDNWEAELNIKRQQFSNMKQELTNMKATHREIMTHCDEMISQIELNGSQKDYYDAMQLRIQEDLRWQKALNDWCLANNLMIRDSGVDGYIFNMLFNEAPDGDVDAFFDSYYEYCKNRSYATTKGVRDAEIDTAFDKVWNEELAKLELNADFAPFMAHLEIAKTQALELFKEMVHTPNNPIQFVTKFVHFISGFALSALGAQAEDEATGLSGGRPNRSPKSSNR